MFRLYFKVFNLENNFKDKQNNLINDINFKNKNRNKFEVRVELK